jgi:hypothetical protein
VVLPFMIIFLVPISIWFPWLRAEPVDQETWPVTTLEEIWPVFGLRVEAGPVELSAIRR